LHKVILTPFQNTSARQELIVDNNQRRGLTTLFSPLICRLRQISRDERGQDLVEYCLVMLFLGLATVVAYRTLANNIANVFAQIGNILTSAT